MDNKTIIQIYYKMLTTYFFERHAAMLSEMNIISSPIYLCRGQESIIAATAVLDADDAVFTGHRNASVLIGCECSVEDMFTELLGGRGGYLGGKSGLLSYSDRDVNVFGSTALPASQFSVAVGAAMAKKLMGEDSVVICFAGDGACCDGSFYEALNMACVYNLPIIFFVENNGYAGRVKNNVVMDVEHVSSRANGFDMRALKLGNDVIEIYNSMKVVRRFAIQEGPIIAEANMNVMYASAYGEDSEYRTQDDIDKAVDEDPIAKLENYILSIGLLSQQDINLYKEKAKAEVEDSFERVCDSLGIEISLTEVV